MIEILTLEHNLSQERTQNTYVTFGVCNLRTYHFFCVGNLRKIIITHF